MHEIGIVRQMVRTVTDFARENGLSGIREVVVDCGELSLVIPEYLEKVYPAVIEGSILEQAKLVIEVTPGYAECDACDEIFNVVENRGYCPNCGSFEKKILSGRDFSIREIRVAEQEEETNGKRTEQ